MKQCYFCDEQYPIEQIHIRKIFDRELQQTLEVDVCNNCCDAMDAGILKILRERG